MRWKQCFAFSAFNASLIMGSIM